MKAIILAAGQGTRLRPLTDDRPKCMVEIKGRSILCRQLDLMREAGVKEEDIYVMAGYQSAFIKNELEGTRIHIIENMEYETTNMVFTLMCAADLLNENDDIIVSYGDIIYRKEIFEKILNVNDEMSVIVDDGWYDYWSERCENPLDDAESLMINQEGCLTEIGQKTDSLQRVQSQYIGLMRFRNGGEKKVLALVKEAERRSGAGEALWRTNRTYRKMYMTDLLQGLIDEGMHVKAVRINRGWFEVDCYEDLVLAERGMDWD